jgi:hypothetical protein
MAARSGRKAFVNLVDNPKTQERIMGMMQTGKPVGTKFLPPLQGTPHIDCR